MKHSLLKIGLVVGLAAAAVAQAPPLAVNANRSAQGAQKILLVNHYQAPATEWILAVHFALPNGQARTVIQHRWGFPVTKERGPIAPGGSVGTGAPAGAQVTCEAVIYADGKTYGDAHLVNAMVAGRKQMLHDLQAAVPLLALDAKSTSTNWSAVAADFQQRSDAAHASAVGYFRSEGGEGPAPVAADRVWNPLLQDISADQKQGKSGPAMAARYAHLSEYYRGWIQQLQSSLPALR